MKFLLYIKKKNFEILKYNFFIISKNLKIFSSQKTREK